VLRPEQHSTAQQCGRGQWASTSCPGVVWALVVDTDTTLFSIFGLILDLLAQIVHPEANE